jgi:hypothetical protein
MQNAGCNGGFSPTIYMYTGAYTTDATNPLYGLNQALRAEDSYMSTTGLCSKEGYPYVSGTSATKCSTPSCQDSDAKVPSCNHDLVNSCATSVTTTTWTDVEKTENALMLAVAKQPVSISVNAECHAFNNYAGGVLDDPACMGGDTDHQVVLVGYGTDATTGKPYWKIKNSWGTKWGENGYVRAWRTPGFLAINSATAGNSYPSGIQLTGPPGPSALAPPPAPLPAGTEPYVNPTVKTCSPGTKNKQKYNSLLGGDIVPCMPTCSDDDYNNGFIGEGSGCPENPFAGHTPLHHQGWCAVSDGTNNYCVIACYPGSEPCGNGMVCHAPGPGYYGVCAYPKA